MTCLAEASVVGVLPQIFIVLKSFAIRSCFKIRHVAAEELTGVYDCSSLSSSSSRGAALRRGGATSLIDCATLSADPGLR